MRPAVCVRRFAPCHHNGEQYKSAFHEFPRTFRQDLGEIRKMTDQKLMYAFRGWIGFVAFMDFGTAIRCFIEGRSYFGSGAYYDVTSAHSNDRGEDSTLPRILGYYSVLKALALTYCTLYIHHRPIINLAICSLSMAIFMYLTEALYHHSTTLNFYIIFPCVLNALTLVGLIILPKRLLEPPVVNEDENVELLKQAQALRRKRHNKREM